MITAYPASPRSDATALLAFDGPADVLVRWTVVEGPGRITPLSPTTDATGRAWALYDPEGGSGRVCLRFEHGA